MVTLAPAATATQGTPPLGSLWARLPPIVPLWRTRMLPISPCRLAKHWAGGPPRGGRLEVGVPGERRQVSEPLSRSIVRWRRVADINEQRRAPESQHHHWNEALPAGDARASSPALAMCPTASCHERGADVLKGRTT